MLYLLFDTLCYKNMWCWLSKTLAFGHGNQDSNFKHIPHIITHR